MALSNQLSINGVPYTIADESQIKTGRRSYVETTRPSQPYEAQTVSVPWITWGPLGNSRGRWSPDFAGSTDYADNLEHRYDWLLTSTAARNAVSLTGLSETAANRPVSDTTKTNWSEGAGDADGDAFDELDEDADTPDDASTYWTTTSSGYANRLQVGTTTGLGRPYKLSGWRVRVRVRCSSTSTNIVFGVSDTTNGYLSTTTDQVAAGDTWETLTFSITESAASGFKNWDTIDLLIYAESGSSTLDVSTMELERPTHTFGYVSSIDYSLGYLFAHRGAFATMIQPATMTEIQNSSRTDPITSTIPEWQGQGLLAHGDDDIVDKRTAAGPNGATYSTITGVDATHLAIGGNKLWLIDAGLTTSADKGKAKYTNDSAALTSGNLSNGFFIADPNETYTNLIPNGPYMLAGHSRGASSFTQSGKEVPILTAVKDLPSAENARAADEGFEGWTYVATKLGLFAVNAESLVANPVGPGEGQEGQAFEGPLDGYPTAVRYFKDTLWVSYLNPDGTSYIFRGHFGPETGRTGRPLWYSFRKLSSLECRAIGAVERTNPTIIVGENENIAYYTLSTRGREIADSNYSFDTGGGTWFGTRMMMPVGVTANLRSARFFTENCDSNNTWTLAVDVDDAESYINVGSAVTSDGAQTVRPVSASVPLTTVSFTSIKPRLTQTANSSTSPPQIRGELVLDIDLRPEYVREVDILIDLERPEQLADLRALIGDNQKPPVKMRLPSQSAVNTDLYGYVITADWYDRSNPDDTVAMVKLREWELS